METDYGKLGASFLHIVNSLDLEIKQYFRKLQEMKTETKCHCEIFTLVSNDGIRQKCLCSYLNPERLRTFYSSIFFNRDILTIFVKTNYTQFLPSYYLLLLCQRKRGGDYYFGLNRTVKFFFKKCYKTIHQYGFL